MALKDLFGKTSEQIVTKQQLDNLYEQAESQGYLEEVVEDKNRFLPSIDFTTASNFARYGSAERYYVDAFKNIYENYPYDGSKKEKQEWRNNSSQLDLYLFDNVYPRTTGYVNLDSNGTLSNDGTFRSGSSPQYIKIVGGPNASPTGKFETANIYDLDTNRESNLGLTALGNTVEFWFKDNLTASNSNYTASYALFDLYNGQSVGSNNYTRLIITKIVGQNKFAVTYRSGSAGITNQTLDYTFDPSTWHHYAFTFANSTNAADLDVCLYVDGNLQLKTTYAGGGNISLANNLNNVAYIGALRADIVTAVPAKEKFGVSCGAFDEFRFWKAARNSQQIYRNWFTQVGGGANTDDANTNLGVYLKFNEGIVDSSNINDLDKICLDSSGRISNGTIVNYNLNVRNTGSAIDDYNSKTLESKDPIIFSTNPLVESVIKTYTDLGFQHDSTNVSSIYSSIPSWITEEAQKNGFNDLSYLVQIISSYFDTLHLQIEALSKIKSIDYDASAKPKPFAKNLLSSNGFENLEIFNDTTFLEDIVSRNESSEFADKISNVKNSIYQNIYNNLAYIYKSKGTEKSLRNLIRCFGIDDELIKINLYANNAQYDLNTKHIYTSIPKKFVDFNDPDRYTGYIIQREKAGDANTKAFIPGHASASYIPLTVQAEVIFPKNPIIDSENYFVSPFTVSSLFGLHEANSNSNILSWGSDVFNFQVYSIREKIGSENAQFKLTGSFNGYGINLTSSFYKDVYDNQKWNFAVRVKPSKYEHANLASGSNISDYTIELVGINSLGDSVDNQFILSTIVPQANMQAALLTNKRIYAGAHYTDFDSDNLEYQTDVKISSVRFWLDYLNNEELIAHSYEANNFGRQQPNWLPAYYSSLNTNSYALTRNDTLVLHWNFYNVTASNASGEFIVEDVSSGSVDAANYYGLGWLNYILHYQMPGFGSEFLQNDSQVVNKEYVFSAKKQNPETLGGNDLVQVVDSDDVTRTRDTRPISYYISIEKSMAQVINDEIMNWFATIKSFNNLIGEPVERYKNDYDQLKHMRELFFNRVGNSLDFERFFQFYKWIDSSLSMMIGQLIPASANASDKVRNMVESHMLERSKYENKLPTIELGAQPKSYPIVSHLSYNYTEQSAPPNNLTADVPVSRYYNFKPQWLKQRAIRTEAPVNTTLQPANDIDREILRQVINERNVDSLPKLYDVQTNGLYDGRKDLSRVFTNVYNLSSDRLYVLEDSVVPVGIENAPVSSRFVFADEIAASSSTDQIVPAYQAYNKRGNYRLPYEVVMMSGRTGNNKSFVNLEGNISGASNLDTNLDIVNRALPERKTVKTVVVERFSAPGGAEVSSRGYLDAAAEEYSVYNSLNYRNSRVRRVLNAWLAESASIDPENPSYHQVNKNVSYSPNPETGLREGDYDNWFIQHQIPQSDAQYSWITASLAVSPSASAFASEFTNLYSTSSLQFLTASQAIPYVNFRWIGSQLGDYIYNSKIYDTSSNTISKETLGEAYPSFASTSLFGYLTNMNGPYGWPSWKQIRNTENPLVVLSRKNNKIIIQDKPTEKTKLVKKGSKTYERKYYPRIEPTFTAYREPPVSYNRPLEQTISISGSSESLELETSYDNNKNCFANDALAIRTGASIKSNLQTYDVLKTLEKDGTYEPKPVVEKISYSSLIYPAKDKVGLKETRSKPSYAEVAGTGSNGYDRNAGEIRSFWRDGIEARRRSNAFYTTSKTGSLNVMNLAQTSASLTASQFIGKLRHPQSWETPYSAFPFISASENVNLIYDSILSTDNETNVILTASIDDDGANYFPISIVNISSALYGDLAGFDEIEARQFLALPSGSYVYQTITKSSGEIYSQEKFKYETSCSFVRPKPSYVYKIHYPNSAPEVFSTPSYAVVFAKYLINVGMPFKTNILAGKNPWYDSYDAYFEDLRPFSIDHTILPEFNFSEKSDYYIKDKNGDLKSLPPENYISFVGTDAQVNSIDNSYNITDKLNNFILNDYEGQKKLKLSVNGLKKLLPYKGFYPNERTAQLAGLFQKSYWNVGMEDLVNGYPTYNGFVNFGPETQVATAEMINGQFVKEGTPLIQQMQTLLQPYFAPGILFNSIKAGIAMDWPTVITNSAQDINYASKKQGPVYGHFLDAPNTVQISQSLGVLVDPYNSPPEYIYFADYYAHTIKYINKYGSCITVCGGNGITGSTNGTGANARFNSPSYLAFSEDKKFIYVTDTFNNAIRKIKLSDFSVTTVTTSSAIPSYPTGITVDTLGNIYFTCSGNNQIRKITTGGTVSVYAGNSSGGFQDGIGTSAKFSSPSGLAIDSNNNIYVADASSNAIRKITPNGSFPSSTGVVTTIAASGSTYGGNIDFVDGINANARFNYPVDVAIDSNNNIYVADRNNNAIRKISYDTISADFYTTTIAGGGPASAGFLNGIGKNAKFNYPVAISSDISGNLYISDQKTNRIRKCSSSGVVTSFVGNGLTGSIDKVSATAVPYFYTTSSFISSSDTEKIYTINIDTLDRLPFESLLDLRGHKENNTLFYLDPTRIGIESFSDTKNYSVWFSGSSPLTSGLPQSDIRYNPQFGFENKNSNNNQTRKFSDNRYQLAINNFLAETPRFFLQGEQLTNFTSGKTINEINFKPGKKYEMSIKIEKQQDIKTILDTLIPDYITSSNSLTSQIISAASTFGPPTKYYNNSSGSEIALGHKAYNGPAYAPYAPPYFFGPQLLKLSFVPELETYGSFKEIIDLLTASCEPANSEFNDYFSASINELGGVAATDNFTSSCAYTNRMPLSASLRYDILVDDSETTYDVKGKVLSRTNKNDTSLSRWRIQTKFESPILNFNTDANKNFLILNTVNDDLYFGGGGQFSSSVTEFGFTGLWSGYAQTGSNSGVSLSILPGNKTKTTEDLAETCGFAVQGKYVGQIAQKKEISEAIIMIPFTRKKNHKISKSDKIDTSFAKTIKEVFGENGKTTASSTNGPYYFAVEPTVINKVLNDNGVDLDFKDKNIPYSNIKKALTNLRPTNSILKTMKAMTEYVLPPHLDWIFNREIDPFVMYVLEFKHELTGDELADIWQGVMPRSAMRISKDSVELEHDLSENELFHGKKLPDDIQWKVFKVKKRASYSYESLVSGVDERFAFRPNTIQDLVFSYNWPYDYFSLVELVNIEAGLEVQTSGSNT